VDVLEDNKMKLVVDVSIPTDCELTSRRPDIVVFLKGNNQITILEVAVCWEPLLKEWEKEKSNKYWQLAASLAIQHPGWKVDIFPVVVGSLGTLRSFRENIGHLGLFTKREVLKLVHMCNSKCSDLQLDCLEGISVLDLRFCMQCVHDCLLGSFV